MAKIKGAKGKPFVRTSSEKELYKELIKYLGKDIIEELTVSMKIGLSAIFKENAKKYKIVGEITTQRIEGTPQKSIGAVKGERGFQGIPAEEKLEGKIKSNRLNLKNLDIENTQDLAEALVYFITGFRGSDKKLTGKEYKVHFSAKKRLIYQLIDSKFMDELSPIKKAKKADYSIIKKTIEGIKKSLRKKKAIEILFITLALGTTLMGIYDQDFIAGLKPEVILGSVPFYSLQMIERAKSDRKLKNRALGDVFLAHQKGNKDVLRLDITLTGPYRFAYLTFLAQLQVEGMSKKKNIGLQPGALASISGVGNYDGVLADKKILNYDVHKTFPIITRTAIIFNMYLQTIEWHQSIDDGKGVIIVHLLFRKYFPTSAFKVVDEIWSEEDGGVIIGGSSMEVVEDYGMAKRWLEFTVDAIWKMSKMHGEIYGRMLVGADWWEPHEIDRQAVSSMSKLVTSYSGKLLGIIG